MVFTDVGDGGGVEHSVGPQLTGLAAAETLHAVGQLVLHLGKHVDRDELSRMEGRKEGEPGVKRLAGIWKVVSAKRF